jgi:hypothetical protein
MTPCHPSSLTSVCIPKFSSPSRSPTTLSSKSRMSANQSSTSTRFVDVIIRFLVLPLISVQFRSMMDIIKEIAQYSGLSQYFPLFNFLRKTLSFQRYRIIFPLPMSDSVWQCRICHCLTKKTFTDTLSRSELLPLRVDCFK